MVLMVPQTYLFFSNTFLSITKTQLNHSFLYKYGIFHQSGLRQFFYLKKIIPYDRSTGLDYNVRTRKPLILRSDGLDQDYEIHKKLIHEALLISEVLDKLQSL